MARHRNRRRPQDQDGYVLPAEMGNPLPAFRYASFLIPPSKRNEEKLTVTDLFEQDWQESAWTWPPVNSVGFVATARLIPVNFRSAINVPRSPIWERNGIVDAYDVQFDGSVETGTITAGRTYRYVYFMLADCFPLARRVIADFDVSPNSSARFAALRPLGDPAVASDWTVWDTPPLTVDSVPPPQ